LKRLYKQFDKQKMNVNTDIHPMDVSDLEKARIKRAVMRGLKKKNHMPRNLSVAAAFLLATGITFSAAFPALAAKLPIVGNFFEQFIDHDDYVFENFDSFSTDIGVTKESNGIKVTVTEAVYDKESITIAYTIEGDHDFGTKPILEGEFSSEELGDKYLNLAAPKYITKKISDTEYAGLFIYELVEAPKSDVVHATWNGTTILDVFDVENQFSGDWKFDLTFQALDSIDTKSFAAASINSKADGINVSLKKMTKTPISTTLYLTEDVDVPVAAMEDEEFRVVVFEYEVRDNLGNDYKAIHFMTGGHSSHFKDGVTNTPRLTTTHFNEDATSITITPYVHVYKFANEVDEDPTARPLELVAEPYAIESMEFDLE